MQACGQQKYIIATVTTVDGACVYIFCQFCLTLEITKLLPELFSISLETAARCLMSLERSGGAYVRFGGQLLIIYLIRQLSRIYSLCNSENCLWQVY